MSVPQSEPFAIAVAAADSADAGVLISQLSAELARRYDRADDGSGHFRPEDVAGARSVFLIGRVEDGLSPAGRCGRWRATWAK